MVSRATVTRPIQNPLLTVLNGLPHGVLVFDRSSQVTVCNPKALELLELPAEFEITPYPAARLIPFLTRPTCTTEGLVGSRPGDAPATIFAFPNERFVKLTPCNIDNGGSFLLIEDISEQMSHERARIQAESEYRSLFENSVYGIYRDNLDGTPIRANPALSGLNGYSCEADHINAVTATPANWYVDAARSEEFKRLMQAEGRVKDLVSEVYRHRTGEKLWITENAWYVRDATGKPIFIEGTIMDATERMANLAAIERQANIDSLTGAANRFHFLGRLNEATGPGKAACLLYTVDLDRFKEVNDSVGHAAGDTILKTVAQRLQAAVRGNSLVARLGGDEFAILEIGALAQAEAAATAGRVVTALCEPIEIAGRSVTIGASVGVSAFPGDAANAEELLRHSDLALYEVKSSGRNGYQFYNTEMKLRLQTRKDMASELRTAVASNRLEVHYQPVVDSKLDRIVGFEALMRWNHPSLGSIPPVVFIPIAEEAGLMTQLGAWVISRACEDLALLPGHLRMGINVSPSQFRSPELFTHIKDTIAKTGIAPNRLVFEITESVLVSNPDAARYLVEDLRGLGCQIALDDFGTGYSALAYLQQFPITVVKIDRSFVAGMQVQRANQAVIRAVMGIGRDLDIDVVAEGVETAEQVAALKSFGCHLMQGFYFGRPQPLTDVIADMALSSLNETVQWIEPKAVSRSA